MSVLVEATPSPLTSENSDVQHELAQEALLLVQQPRPSQLVNKEGQHVAQHSSAAVQLLGLRGGGKLGGGMHERALKDRMTCRHGSRDA